MVKRICARLFNSSSLHLRFFLAFITNAFFIWNLIEFLGTRTDLDLRIIIPGNLFLHLPLLPSLIKSYSISWDSRITGNCSSCSLYAVIIFCLLIVSWRFKLETWSLYISSSLTPASNSRSSFYNDLCKDCISSWSTS